jgi:hypothetical protein
MAGHGLLLDRPRPRKTKSAIGEVMGKWIDVRRVIERGGAEIQNRLLSRAAARLILRHQRTPPVLRIGPIAAANLLRRSASKRSLVTKSR